jgi:hypothetical protein
MPPEAGLCRSEQEERPRFFRGSVGLLGMEAAEDVEVLTRNHRRDVPVVRAHRSVVRHGSSSPRHVR